MQYSELKTYVQTLYGAYIGSGKIIESESGSPSALAVLFDLVHNRIAGYPYDFPCLKVTSTITLTGASSYNLAILFPDLKSVYQIYGINQNQESGYLPNYEGNILPNNDSYTLKNKTLTFTGTAPASGTAYIQYKSQYLVKDAAGTRKRYFENADDETVLDTADVNALLFGIGEYVNWKSDELSKQRRDENRGWFKEAWENMFSSNEQSSQVHSLL